jgi:hypothetical protein
MDRLKEHMDNVHTPEPATPHQRARSAPHELVGSLGDELFAGSDYSPVVVQAISVLFRRLAEIRGDIELAGRWLEVPGFYEWFDWYSGSYEHLYQDDEYLNRAEFWRIGHMLGGLVAFSADIAESPPPIVLTEQEALDILSMASFLQRWLNKRRRSMG